MTVTGESSGFLRRTRCSQRVCHTFCAGLSSGKRLGYGFGADAFASLSFGFQRIPLWGRGVGLLLRSCCDSAHDIFLAQVRSSGAGRVRSEVFVPL